MDGKLILKICTMEFHVLLASDIEITLKREVPIVEEKHVLPLILYIVSSSSLQYLAAVVVSVIVKLLLYSFWVFIGSKEGYMEGLCIKA